MIMDEQKKNYETAVEYMNTKNAVDDDYLEAEEFFLLAGDYKDAAKKAEECRAAAEKWRENKIKSERKKKKKGNALVVFSVAVCVLALVFIKLSGSVKLCINANALMQNGSYGECAELLKQVDDKPVKSLYSDKKLYECASVLLEYGEYEKAADAYNEIYYFSDSSGMYKKATYLYAKELLTQNEHQYAYDKFSKIKKYKDSADYLEIIPSMCYEYAQECLANGDIENAIYGFKHKCVRYYLDSSDMAHKLSYQYGCEKLEQGDFETAEKYLLLAKNIDDTAVKLNDLYYAWGISYFNSGEYEAALEKLEKIQWYKDAMQYSDECKYRIAGEYEASGDIKEAYGRFSEITGYKDSDQRAASLKK